MPTTVNRRLIRVNIDVVIDGRVMRASSEDSLTTRCCAALGFNGVKTLLIVINLVFVVGFTQWSM